MDPFMAIMRYRKFIVASALISLLVSLLTVCMMPNRYRSTVSVFPVKESGVAAGLGSVASPLSSFSEARRSSYTRSLTRALVSAEADRLLAILKSRSLLLSVVRQFDLVHVYHIRDFTVENATNGLLKNIEYSIIWEGILSITVTDEDPQRAADIANFIADDLVKSNADLIAQSVRGNSQLIEEFYRITLRNLANAEDSLKNYQERSGVLDVTEQTREYFNTLSDLTHRLLSREIEVEQMKKVLSADHPLVEAIQGDILELRRNLSELSENARQSESGAESISPFWKASKYGPEYERRSINVEVQEDIFRFSKSLIEQAQAQAEWTPPVLEVLDRAVPPEREFSPRRVLIILGGLLIGSGSAIAFALLRTAWERWISENLSTLSTILHH